MIEADSAIDGMMRAPCHYQREAACYDPSHIPALIQRIGPLYHGLFRCQVISEAAAGVSLGLALDAWSVS